MIAYPHNIGIPGLTLQDAARLMNLSYQTVWKYSREGAAVGGKVVKLRTARVGPRSIRTRHEWIQEFCQELSGGEPIVEASTPEARASCERLLALIGD